MIWGQTTFLICCSVVNHPDILQYHTSVHPGTGIPHFPWGFYVYLSISMRLTWFELIWFKHGLFVHVLLCTVVAKCLCTIKMIVWQLWWCGKYSSYCLCFSSSSLVAVWDQDGGFMNDHYGRRSQEWSWQTHSALKKKVVIQVKKTTTINYSNRMSLTQL